MQINIDKRFPAFHPWLSGSKEMISDADESQFAAPFQSKRKPSPPAKLNEIGPF
jgi:hypothetical protein